MKLRTIFVILLIVATSLTGCGKNERIEGKVQDIFGNTLKDVTVKIQKSTFSSNTDGSGKYSLDYAPGSMKLIFSKDGYTTCSLDLSIQQKSHFPAEVITLYPIPQENGMFYIDTGNKRLVKLEENGKIEVKQIQADFRYFVKYSKPAIIIKPGKAMFIDRISYNIELTSVQESGLFYEGTLTIFERHDKYVGFLKGSASEIGEEKLLIRTYELSPGSYAWITMSKAYLAGYWYPDMRGAAFGIATEGYEAVSISQQQDGLDKEKHDSLAKLALKNLATAQDNYYSTNGRYAFNRKNLSGWTVDPTVTVNILGGGVSFWSATARHKNSNSVFTYDSAVGGLK